MFYTETRYEPNWKQIVEAELLEKKRKDFEEWINKHPQLKGGNTFQTTTEQYGVALKTPEYVSSWMQGAFEAYLEIAQ